ncbi:GIY-YIG nuclease family protein [Gramella sp. AN32]|uniref:GIY-YIG nuclease family protein n=1 Tax=Christiangramia antarctica TaxID=2058158 RepID=A0ABW5X8K3_9FLAO|nr:GIY-YIG nuclease family protein [Gramella sp. AN32]MCM4158167.1 hypothetical protein [Gramella sp. AN32]
MNQSSVYIITNKNNTVLYTGVTSDLLKRIYEHKTKLYKESFSARYNCNKLVFYTNFDSIFEAIEFEKKMKAGSRAKKIRLIKSANSEWKDLAESWFFEI